ncbi:MAG: anti-sigma factor [Solirubrobacteraceae bacterium]
MSDERSERGHEGSCGDAPLYVLGLLDADDAARFLAHAESCVVCRDEIAALGPAIEALAESVPPQRAPPELRERLVGRIRAEATATEAIEAAKGKRRSGRSSEMTRRTPQRGLVLAAGSSALLAAGCALGALVIASPSPSSPRTTTLSAQVSIRGASAELHRSGPHTWLTISNMPQPGTNRIYEVWVRRGAVTSAPSPTSALFTPNDSGAATVAVPGNLAGASQVLVTAEPAGGTLSPTREPVIVARLS